jgi:hypothetical protein
MTDHISHDPRTKQQIKDALFAFLYDPVEKMFKDQLEKLIIRNAVINGYSHKSFVYKGVLYNCDSSPVPRKMNRLAPQLQPEMNGYLKEVKALNEKEIPFVLGYITQALNSSNDLCDYYRLFPESVHAPLRKIIETCPCRMQSLPEEVVVLLQEKNKGSIDLMRQRMTTNLLL